MASRYRFGVAWIAGNDEPLEENQGVIAELISVQLLADMYGKDPARVAKDVLAARRAAPIAEAA